MKQINEKLYVNEDKVQSVQKIEDQYYLITSFGSSINISEELFDDLKDYEGSGGGGSTGPVVYESSTDATLVSGDTYELDLSYLSATPKADDYVAYVESDTISTLYLVDSVGDTTVTLTKIGDVGQGGGAELNIAYGLTPPTDTNKIWVKTDADISNVIVSDEDRAVVGEAIKESGTINVTTYATQGLTSSVKIGNAIYFTQPASIAITGSGSNYQRIYKLDLSTNQISIYLVASNSVHVVGKKDENTFYYFDNTTGSTCVFYEHNVITNSSTQLFTINSFGVYYVALDGDYIMSCSLKGSNNYIIANIYRYNLKTNTLETFAQSPYIYNHLVNVVFKNGKMYYGRNTYTTTSTNYYKNTTTIYEYDYVNNVTTVLKTYSRKVIFSDYDVAAGVTNGYLAVIGNKIDVFGGATQIINASQAYSQFYAYYSDYYQLAIGCVSDNEVYIFGGRSASSEIYRADATIISLNSFAKYTYNWSLEENNLLLSGEVNGILLPIVSSANAIVKQHFSYCWLGNSNDIAVKNDLLYNKNNAWYGINCEDWNRIISASISVPNTSLNMNVSDTNTQVYTCTISSVTRNNTPTYNVVADSKDTTIADATIDEANETITIATTSQIGIVDIDLKLVDNYGSTFKTTIQVNTLGFEVVYNIIDITDTTLTQSITCKVGDLIVASVIARDSGNEVVSSDWTLLGKQVGNYLNQDLAFYYKIAESTTESITVTQTSSARIYISMVAFTGKTTATIGTFEQYDGQLSGTIELPTDKICLVSAGSNLWSTVTPYQQYTYEGTNYYIADLFDSSIQGRLGTWIDYGNGGERTITGLSAGDNSLIIGYVVIE